MEVSNNNNRGKELSSEQEGAVVLKDILLLCLRNWYWFLISVVLALGVMLVYVSRIEPQYTRTAMIQIKDDSKGRSINGGGYESFADFGLIQTKSMIVDEIGILQSPALMEEVVRRLGLDVTYREEGRFYNRVLYGSNLPLTVRFVDLDENTTASLAVNVAQDGESYTLSDIINRGIEVSLDSKAYAFSDTITTPMGRVVVDKTPFFKSSNISRLLVTKSTVRGVTGGFSGRLSAVQKDKQSKLVNITFSDVSVQRANDVINTLVDVYNDKWVEDKNQIARSTTDFINERLSIIEEELGDVDEGISSYKSEKLIPDVQSVSNIYLSQKTQSENELMELNNQLSMARYVRDYLTTPGNEMQMLPANSGIGNGTIEAQISEFNTKLLRRNDLAANSSENNPLVVDMDNTLMAIRASIITSVDNSIVTLNQQLERLRQVEARATQQLATNPTQAQHLLSVGRQQKVKEALYLFLLQKREETQLSQAFTAYNTRIITPPMGSSFPTSPKKKQFYLIALLIGLAIPVAVIYIREISNTKVRGKADLKNLVVPFIGEIPMYGSSKSRKGEGDTHPVVVKEGRRDIINEAFRVVRTNLDFMVGSDANQKVFVFTSFNIGSGKSFISVNTAISFALKGKKVLVIDGDMRHSSASCYVNSPKTGMSDYLSGRIEDVEQVIVNAMNYENLYVLPVGTTPPNPTELLMQERFGRMIDHFREEFDYVFIDCPPLDIVADAQIISQHADRMLFIIRAGLFERSLLGEVNALYEEQKYKNMSVILNGTESGDHRYSYKYGYRYGYKYGYSYSHSYYGNDKSQDKNSWKEIV